MTRVRYAEEGFSFVEVLIVVAILAAGALCAVTLSGGGHAGSRSATLMQLVSGLDRAHNLAAANGAALQVSPDPSGVGSDIVIYDAFAGGNVISSITTPEIIAGYCTGPNCSGRAAFTSFTLRVRRDGSFDGDMGTGLVGAQTVTLGISDNLSVKEAFTMNTSDLHAPFVEGS